MEYARVPTRWQIREYVIPVTVALVLVACLPLLGVMAFALRTVLLIAVPIAILVFALTFIRWKCVGEWWAAKLAPESSYRGLHMARDVVFHPGHCWASIDAEIVVGADDLVQAALGPIDEVALPDEGVHVNRGEPLFRLRHADRVIELASPVSGTVLRINPELREHPELINQKPFSAGWIVRLHGEDLPEDRRHMLHGRQAWSWFRREVDLVLRILPPEQGAAEVRPACLYQRVDDGAWGALRSALGAAPDAA